MKLTRKNCQAPRLAKPDRRSIRGIALGVGAAMTLTALSASAVHDDGTFELDRNAVDDAAAGDDWNTEPMPTGGAFAYTGIVSDPVPESTIFSTGKSKDVNDVSEWKWKAASNILDKNNITNAYAAAYNVNGELVIYFGLDRFSNDGSAQVGFWFFRDDVSLNADGTFNGTHQNGDVLVQSNFSQGGSVDTVTAYEWQNGNLVQIGTGGDCDAAPAGDNVCAVVNQNSTSAPWAYAPKPNIGPPGSFPQGTFFEGGINLSGLGLTNSCFSTFLAETRSSTPFDAVLKDFVGPRDFDTCSLNVTKSCVNPRLNNAQDMIIYDIQGTVTAQGFGAAMYDVALTDNPPADGAFQWVDCNDSANVLGTFPLAELTGNACYLNTITVPLAQNGTTDTVTVTGTTEDGDSNTALSDSATATCPNLSVSPALSVTKDCATSIVVSENKVVAQVNVSGMVCNTGDTNLSNVTVTDQGIVTDPNPLIDGATLAPGACQSYSGSYLPSAAQDTNGVDTTCPSEVVFKDTVEATATDIFGQGVTPQTDMATCKLCPPGGCPAP